MFSFILYSFFILFRLIKKTLIVIFDALIKIINGNKKSGLMSAFTFCFSNAFCSSWKSTESYIISFIPEGLSSASTLDYSPGISLCLSGLNKLLTCFHSCLSPLLFPLSFLFTYSIISLYLSFIQPSISFFHSPLFISLGLFIFLFYFLFLVCILYTIHDKVRFSVIFIRVFIRLFCICVCP